jgi:hypothetical protein
MLSRHFPSVISEVLIVPASLIRSPAAFVCLYRSDPARSTMVSWLTVTACGAALSRRITLQNGGEKVNKSARIAV